MPFKKKKKKKKAEEGEFSHRRWIRVHRRISFFFLTQSEPDAVSLLKSMNKHFDLRSHETRETTQIP